PRTAGASAWRGVASAWIETLPARLPAGNWRSALRVMVGSCFARTQDGGQVSGAFAQLWEHPGERPAVKFYVGDQVYLDIGLPILRMSADQIRARVLGHYARTWETLGSMLSCGGTWMLPDDHEYYNYFPDALGVYNPHLRASGRYRATWTKVAIAAV